MTALNTVADGLAGRGCRVLRPFLGTVDGAERQLEIGDELTADQIADWPVANRAALQSGLFVRFHDGPSAVAPDAGADRAGSPDPIVKRGPGRPRKEG